MQHPIAVVSRAFGSPESFMLEEVQTQEPGHGEIRLAVKAAAVNFVDILVAAGRYQLRPPLPFTPGGEFSGIIDAIGPGVADLAIGQHVSGSGLCGAYSQSLVVRASAVSVLPQGMSFIEGATFRVANGTAMAALVQGARIVPGETMLVLGAGGGVGYAAAAIGKALGATVIGAASSGEKRALAMRAGADAVISIDDTDWRASLRETLAGRTLDVVVDPVGGSATEPAFRALGWGGRHMVIGFAGGSIPALPTNLPLLKGSSLIGVNFGQFVQRQPGLMTANLEMLIRWWTEGRLTAPPTHIFPLSDFVEAMHMASLRTTLGRVVIEVATG
jgi:NADPH2:quinone reductase